MSAQPTPAPEPTEAHFLLLQRLRSTTTSGAQFGMNRHEAARMIVASERAAVEPYRAIGHAIQSVLNDSGAPSTDDQVAGVEWLLAEVKRLTAVNANLAQICVERTDRMDKAESVIRRGTGERAVSAVISSDQKP